MSQTAPDPVAGVPVEGPVGSVPYAGPRRVVGKTREPWKVWALGFITGGIYTLYWYYKVNAELKAYDPRIDVNPGMSLAALLVGWLVIVPPFVSIFKTGSRIASAQEAAGVQGRASGGIGLLLAFVASLFPFYYQAELNKVWAMHGNPPEGTTV